VHQFVSLQGSYQDARSRKHEKKVQYRVHRRFNGQNVNAKTQPSIRMLQKQHGTQQSTVAYTNCGQLSAYRDICLAVTPIRGFYLYAKWQLVPERKHDSRIPQMLPYLSRRDQLILLRI